MEYGCKDRVVLITGGTSGIGLAAARAFWLDGASVSIVGRDRVRGMKALAEIAGCKDPERVVFPGAKEGKETFTAAEEIKEENCSDIDLPENSALERLRFIRADVTKQADCRMAAVIAAHYGKERIHILVNSAGLYQEKRIEQVTAADYNRIMDVNVKGTLLMIQACQPYMLPHGEETEIPGSGSGGNLSEETEAAKTLPGKKDRCIINIASDAGIGGNYGCPVYCASKGAVVSLTRALALDMSPDIRVNCICPGDVDTPLMEAQLKAAGDGYTKEDMAAEYPLGRVALPEEVAHVICSVASPANSFMTGAVIPVDGGLMAIG